MADNRKKLLKQWEAPNRFVSFGNALNSISINGFRGIDNLTLVFEYPITAISGANGSGKTTMGQIAMCAYKGSKRNQQYFGNYFPLNKLDPMPFTNNASVTYKFATNAAEYGVSIIRKKDTWDGYAKRIEKTSFYLGFSFFIPKIERKDISILHPTLINAVGNKQIVRDEIKKVVSNILNSQYNEISFQNITDGDKKAKLGFVQKYNYSYSENNMGFGEARLLYLVDILENSPNKCLFVLEEPETSLHEDAQYKFVKYLMDVCARKKHQIILSTHSNIILEALPPEGRKFIVRDKNGVKILDRVSANRVKSFLTDGQQKALKICVEDNFAKTLLQEAIRLVDKSLSSAIQIEAIGDTFAVFNAVKLLCSLNINAIGIRDADKEGDKATKMFKLPGSFPPEKEVYNNPIVIQKINEKYGIDTEFIFSTQQQLDHHNYAKLLSEKAFCPEQAMNQTAIEAYLDNKKNEFEELVNIIRSEI
jgi:predicted ATPase